MHHRIKTVAESLAADSVPTIPQEHKPIKRRVEVMTFKVIFRRYSLGRYLE